METNHPESKPDEREKILAFGDLLAVESARRALVSRGDLPFLFMRHFRECLAPALLELIPRGARVIDADVLAETIIPEVIDVDLALQDLQEINNYSLAMELGIELYRAGATATDWVRIKEDQELLQQRVECDLDAWFKVHSR